MEKFAIVKKVTYDLVRYVDEVPEILDSDEEALDTRELLNESTSSDKNLSFLIDKVKSDSKWRLYPIYSFTMQFKYKDEENLDWKDSSFTKLIMYKDEKNDEFLDSIISDFIDKLSLTYKEIHPVSSYEHSLLRYETWCCEWFNHYTYDVGQSDYDVIDSFEMYVRRHEHMQNIPFDIMKKYIKNHEYVCLMGAEDRYRWGHYQKDENGKVNDSSNFIYGVPCRCSKCQSAGVIRIDH